MTRHEAGDVHTETCRGLGCPCYLEGQQVEAERWHTRINALIDWWCEIDSQTPAVICGVLERLKGPDATDD